MKVLLNSFRLNEGFNIQLDFNIQFKNMHFLTV